MVCDLFTPGSTRTRMVMDSQCVLVTFLWDDPWYYIYHLLSNRFFWTPEDQYTPIVTDQSCCRLMVNGRLSFPSPAFTLKFLWWLIEIIGRKASMIVVIWIIRGCMNHLFIFFLVFASYGFQPLDVLWLRYWSIRRWIQGGGPGGPAPPLTLGFEAPKLSIFGALFNFSIIFFASLRSAYYFFNMLLFHSSNWKIFQPHFARHVISHLQVLVSHILGY